MKNTAGMQPFFRYMYSFKVNITYDTWARTTAHIRDWKTDILDRNESVSKSQLPDPCRMIYHLSYGLKYSLC